MFECIGRRRSAWLQPQPIVTFTDLKINLTRTFPKRRRQETGLLFPTLDQAQFKCSPGGVSTGAASCLIAEVFAEVQTLAIFEVSK